jgi:hypothetical protein
MEGAAEAWKSKRALVWWGAMMAHLKEPPDLEKFSGYRPDRREQLRRWVDAWDRVEAGLRRNKHGG